MTRHVRLPGYSASDLDRLSYSNGDIVNDITNKTIRLMDGETPGGFKFATEDYVQTNAITTVNLSTNLTSALLPYAKTVDLAPYALTADVTSAISAIPIYTLPTAGVGSGGTKGGVRVDGTSITIDGNGVIHGANTYTLPTAVAGTSITGTLGGVIPDGTTITINNGVISGANTYVLPTASTTIKGGVKVDGTTILIDGSGVISGANQYVLPTATTTVKGGVIIPAVATSGLTNSSGTIGLATATSTQLGGVTIPAVANSGLTITSGAVRLATATTNQLGGVKVDGVTITINGSGVIAANITGAIVFQGGWSAATNTPTLSNASSAYNTNGFEFVTTAAGTVNFGAGNVTFAVGDNVIYDGVKWVKIPIGSSAGTVNSLLTVDNSGTGNVSGTTFNGSSPITISYNSIGASPTAGSSSLTTLGTIATGTWNGSVIGPTYGGTGVNNGSFTLTITGGNRTLNQDVNSSSSPNFDGTNFTGTAASLTAGNATLAATATLAGRATNVAGGVANNIPYQTAINTTSFITAPSVDSTYLKYTTAGGLAWSTVGLATAATNLAGGGANRIHVQTGADTSGFIVAPTVTGTYLQWNGSAFVFSAVSGASGGTVTSVGGTGTVNGLTLTGTVTGSGNLTLGGTLSLVSPPAIGSTTANTGAFTILTVNSASTSAVTLSPTGSGTVTINPSTAGTINNMTIGASIATTGRFTTVTSTQATGTAPFTVASTTNVANLNASSLNGATFASPGAIGGTAASSGAFTTISATGQITSTLATGTAPFAVTSTTNVANLNASSLSGATFAAPGAIGSSAASSGAFTSVSANLQAGTTTGSGTIFLSNATSGRIDYVAGGLGAPTFSTVSVGTKIVLYPALGAAAADWAIGIDTGTTWFSVPAASASYHWTYYGGTTKVADLSGTGVFTTTGSIGYPTGAATGGAVTQGTSRTTGVTLNKITGQITLFAVAGTPAWLTFTVSNSTVAATDTVIVNAATGTNTYLAIVSGVRAGAFDITFYALVGTASDSPVFNFAVIKGSAS
jgi:hypothetical protein